MSSGPTSSGRWGRGLSAVFDQRLRKPLRDAAGVLLAGRGLRLARFAFAAALGTLGLTLLVVVLGLVFEWPDVVIVTVVVPGLIASALSTAWLVGELQRIHRRQPIPTVGAITNWRQPLSTLDRHFQQANEVRISPKPIHYWPVVRPTGRPQVSIVVTAYNCSNLLAQTLSSLQLQDFEDWECVVVDDGSTDHTFDVACRFAEQDGRFSVLRQTNHGLPHARNSGLLASTGDVVTFLDGDDVLLPSALSARLERWQTGEPTFAGVYCDWRPFPGEDPPNLSDLKPRPLQSVTALSSPWDCPFIASAPLVRRDVITQIGGFDESLTTAEDADLWTRLLRAGYVFTYAPYVGIGYRQLPKGMIRRTAVQHALVMDEVAARAERPIDDPAILAGPMPMAKPLSFYVRHHTMSGRMVRFMVMALAAGDRAGAERVAETLDAAIVKLHPDPDFVATAIRSALGRLGLLSVQHAREAARLTDEARDVLLTAARQAEIDRASLPVVEELPERARHDLRGRGPLIGGASPVQAVTSHLLLYPPGEELEAVRDAVILLPESRYHVDELGPIADEMRRRGHKAIFMARAPGVLRRQVLREISKYAAEAWEWDETLPERVPVAGVVTLNDWGPGRDLIMSAQRSGAVTFAKVEGVQDFGDLDTGRERAPYRTADVVLGQGVNDAEVLADRQVHVVGNYRLEQIWQQEPRRTWVPTAAINLNFTYDVQIEHANTWLRSVLDACRLAGVDYVISPHPAQIARPFDGDLLEHNVATAPMRHVLREAGVLVTRFSTVIYEAIARGVPVIYHNPHGEQVWEQMPGYGTAIVVTRSTRELVTALAEAQRIAPGYREQAAEFFLRQVDVDPARPAYVRAADEIEAAITRRAVAARH